MVLSERQIRTKLTCCPFTRARAQKKKKECMATFTCQCKDLKCIVSHISKVLFGSNVSDNSFVRFPRGCRNCLRCFFQKSGVTLSRSSLVNHGISDKGFLSFICDFPGKHIKVCVHEETFLMQRRETVITPRSNNRRSNGFVHMSSLWRTLPPLGDDHLLPVCNP